MAKERRSRERDVQGAKPLTWYAAPKDRHTVDEIALSESGVTGRTPPATDIITLAVRVLGYLYKSDPTEAMAIARKASQPATAK